MSRLMQRGLYPKPSDRGFRGACGLSIAATGLVEVSISVYTTTLEEAARYLQPRKPREEEEEEEKY
jgi:hypothetical protein